MREAFDGAAACGRPLDGRGRPGGDGGGAAGGSVLLAPACASFDMFEDYAARGRAFKAEVEALRREHA